MNEIKYLLADFIDEFNRADMAKKQQMVKRFPFKREKGDRHEYHVIMLIFVCYFLPIMVYKRTWTTH